MSKKSVIKLPNGTIIEISPDFSPEQIQAMISASIQPINIETKQIPHEIKTVDEIWQGSKREKLALFIRSFFSTDLWFQAKQVLEEQLTHIQVLVFGDSSQINTYLKRLHEMKLLERKTRGKKVLYKIHQNLINEYPEISTNEFIQKVVNEL